MSAVVSYLQVREKQAENYINSFLRQSHTDTAGHASLLTISISTTGRFIHQIQSTGSRNTDVYGLEYSRSHSQQVANREMAPNLLCHNHRCRLSHSGCLAQYFFGREAVPPSWSSFLTDYQQ